MSAAPVAQRDLVAATLDHIKWHQNEPDVPHWYIATVKDGDGQTLFLSIAEGFQRWTNRLGYTLTGNGYWIRGQHAQEAAEKACKRYKDYDHREVVVVKLSHKDAIAALEAELEL